MEGNCIPKLPRAPTILFDKFLLTSFPTNVPPECHELAYKPKSSFLLAPVTPLFCTITLKTVAPPMIAMVS